MIKIRIKKRKQKGNCPEATQNLELNTKNRNASIKAEHIQYGPLNLEVESSFKKEILSISLKRPQIIKASEPL